MTADRRRRRWELYRQAGRLEEGERSRFLERECAHDAELRREVESLLQRGSTETMLDVAGQEALDDAPPPGRTIAVTLFGSKRRRISTTLAAGVLLVGLGLWTHRGIEGSLRHNRADQLRGLLDANVLALKLWIEDRKSEVRAWASDDRVQRYVAELVEIGRKGPTAAKALRDSAPLVKLDALLRPYLEVEDIPAFSVTDRTGLILADRFREHIGLRVGAAGAGYMAEVFEGNTCFSRPYPANAWVNHLPTETKRPITWFDTPVPAVSGDPVAALGFGYFADRQFAGILSSVGRHGETGETYAFDATGLLLSESRFVAALRASGLVPPDGRSMLAVQVRDPGGDLTRGHRAGRDLEARHLTEMAALAIARRARPEARARRGVILDPYRNYLGVEVIGAWQWLSEYGFGVATEIEAGEAFASLRYVDVLFAVLFGILVLLAFLALFSTASVVRLRRQIGLVKRLGQYRLKAKIGEGGMGEVHLAEHALLKRPTAVKILKPELLTESTIARFEREVRLASRLTHPNTIEIYDYGRTADGVFYYAMEYLPGLTLDELVAREHAIAPARAVYILRQVLASLREAHASGLVHRDVKPANIMLCERGGEHDVVKVLDFGLVKQVEPDATRDLTGSLLVAGTPRYMAPERFTESGRVDARSDLYSVGGVAYFLLTGRNLFQEAGARLFELVMNATPEPPSALVDHPIPERLERLVMQCLAKDPDRRPRTAGEISEVLGSLEFDAPWTSTEAKTWWRRYHDARAD